MRSSLESASSSIHFATGAAQALAPQASSLAHLSRAPSQTFLRFLLPFGSDLRLRSQSVNRWGLLRVGILLEELDAFAGNVAYTFVEESAEEAAAAAAAAGEPARARAAPPTLVTASFDRLDLLKLPLRADEDLELRGMVTFAGSSSMNVDIDIVRAATGVPIVQAACTFVARNAANRPVPVPRLAPVTARERRLHAAGRAATEARKRARQASLLRHPPTAAELAAVHALAVEGLSHLKEGAHGAGPVLSRANSVFPHETVLQTTILTMPQNRNLHGKVRIPSS